MPRGLVRAGRSIARTARGGVRALGSPLASSRALASRAVSSRAGGFIGSHLGAAAAVGTAAYFGYRGIKGFAGQVIPAMTDAAMDVAFDDPQADRAVLGTDLTPSLYLGVKGPGVIGQLARTKNATRFGLGAHNPVSNTIGGSVIGGLAGGGLGAKMGFNRAGIRGAIIGGALGAVGGGMIGGGLAAAGVASAAYSTARTNSQIMNESPFYNHSALTAQRLNASGNIVLGMHNQRRG